MSQCTAEMGMRRHDRGRRHARSCTLRRHARTAGAVEIHTLTNDHGLRVRFLSYGGVITEIDIPDRRGRLDNIVLGLTNIP